MISVNSVVKFRLGYARCSAQDRVLFDTIDTPWRTLRDFSVFSTLRESPWFIACASRQLSVNWIRVKVHRQITISSHRSNTCSHARFARFLCYRYLLRVLTIAVSKFDYWLVWITTGERVRVTIQINQVFKPREQNILVRAWIVSLFRFELSKTWLGKSPAERCIVETQLKSKH